MTSLIYSFPAHLGLGFWSPTCFSTSPFDLLHKQDKTDGNKKNVLSRCIAFDAMTMAGYFPLIGIIVGLFRQQIITKELTDPKDPRNKMFANFAKIQKLRSYAEILCLGALFLLPDLIATILRCCQTFFCHEKAQLLPDALYRNNPNNLNFVKKVL